MKAKKEKTEARLPPWLPQDLSEKELNLCNSLFDSYLFITPDKQGRTCVCSRCRRTYRVEKKARLHKPEDMESLYAKQGYEIKCRECGCGVKVRWAKISHSKIWAEKFVVFVRQLSHDSVRLDCYHLIKGYSTETFDLLPRWRKNASYLLTPGAAVQHTRRYYWYCKSQDDNDPENWTRRSNDKVPLEPFPGQRYRVFDKHLLSGTFLQYSGLDEWINIRGYHSEWCTVKYLALRAMYPALETLLKAGYKEIVDGFVIRDRRYYGKLDLQATTPCAVFKESRHELSALKRFDREQEPALMWRCKKKKKDDWLLSDIAALYECRVYLKTALEFCERHKSSPRELVRYLHRQYDKRRRQYDEELRTNPCLARHGGGLEPTIVSVWHDLSDFHEMYFRENGVPARELYPKDVGAAHDALVHARDKRLAKQKADADRAWKEGRQQRMKDARDRWESTTKEKVEAAGRIDNDPQHSEKLQERLRWRVKHLSFYEGDYLTVIPQATIDLVREGEALHHCVGTYLERYAKGTTNIVFLRNKDHIDQPLITVEVANDGRMVQCYGFDDDRTWSDEKEWMQPERDKYLAVYRTEIRAFAEHYKKHLEQHFEAMKQKKERKERVTA